MTVLTTKPSSPSSRVGPELPQLVPGSTCARCDVCCRFPDPDSPLRPFFTDHEVTVAIEAGLDQRAFPDRSGCQIVVVPDSTGEGFLCPAFHHATGTCGIYAQRPFDCRLYPLAIMWDATHDAVVLGWDAKCPFMLDQVPQPIRTYADRVMEMLREPETVRMIAAHPRMIGGFQDDVVVLAPLPEITQALAERWGEQPLNRLRLEDLPRLTAALDRSRSRGEAPLAALSAAYHYIWNGVLAYWWTELEGAFCLFLQSPDGWFMPLPPLTDGAIDAPLAEAFRLMRRWNGESAVSRVENISATLAAELESMGYRLAPKDPDYLYQAAALASLKGDRLKSQRALCNRVERNGPVTIEPYHVRDRKECRALFQEWQRQKCMEGMDRYAAFLLEDALPAHEVAWSDGLGEQLLGTVLRLDGRIRAYTFGTWLSKTTWCVVLEVADRTIPGLAQYLFRETCRGALSEGADCINTMDDAGLAGLRLSKQAYHPSMQIRSFICSEAVRR